MPFVITTQPFGPMPTAEDREPLTEYVVLNTDTNEGFSVIPAYGGIIRNLLLQKGDTLYSIIRGPESPQALFADESYAGALLFPFPGRLKDGTYMFEGKSYTLPVNEAKHHNALHGLVYGQPFELVHQEAGPTHASLTLRYDYSGNIHGYPFPFTLAVLYGLDRPSGSRSSILHVTYKVVNTGNTRIPAAFGWHPYFSLNEEPVDNLVLTLPVHTAVTLNDGMLPAGREPFTTTDRISMHERSFDTPFLVNFSDQERVETALYSPKFDTTLRVGQDNTFPYLVVYTPPRRDSIAIEPMTANVNAFNTGEGLQTIEPGESIAGKIWVRLT